jgi:hypothetical protein
MGCAVSTNDAESAKLPAAHTGHSGGTAVAVSTDEAAGGGRSEAGVAVAQDPRGQVALPHVLGAARGRQKPVGRPRTLSTFSGNEVDMERAARTVWVGGIPPHLAEPEKLLQVRPVCLSGL